MTTATNNQRLRSGQSAAPRNGQVSPILASQPGQISPEQHERDMSDLCYALGCVNAVDMPDSTIFELAEFLLQSVDKDCVNLTVGPQYEDLMEELHNTLQLMNFHCWTVLAERHNRLNGTPKETLFRALTLPECTATSMREQPENFHHLLRMLSFVGVRKLNLPTDDGVHDLRDICMLRGLEEVSVLAPVGPQRWLLLVRPATRVTVLGSEVPAIRVHCDARHDILRLATFAEGTANFAQALNTCERVAPERVDEPPHQPPDPAAAEEPAGSGKAAEPEELARALGAHVDVHPGTQVQGLVNDREVDTVHVHFTRDHKAAAAGNESMGGAMAGELAPEVKEEPRKNVKVRLKKKRVTSHRPQFASADPGASVARVAPAKSSPVPCEELQQPKQPLPAPGSPLQQLRPHRSAANPSSMALMALFGTAMLAGGLRQSLGSSPQFEPRVAGPTSVPPDLTPEIIQELMASGTLLGPGGMSFLEDPCPAQDAHGPDLVAALGASRHLLREAPSPQPLAVDTRPPEAGFDAHPQLVADLMAGKGFDGKPGLLVALGSGQTAEVAAYMKRLAALDLDPRLSGAILANAADEYHALAHAMLSQHITSMAAFMDGLKDLRLGSQQIADIVQAWGSRGYSGLHAALVEEKRAAVAEFLDRLKGLGLDPQQMADVVAARNINGYPGLFYAMERGSSLSVPVFIEGLKGLGLSRPQMAGVVAAQGPELSGALSQALGRGHAAAVSVFTAGLKELDLLPGQIVDILAAKDSAGNPGLYVAQMSGHAAAVTAFMKGLKGLGLSGPQILDIIKCENVDGVGGLYMALQAGQTGVVRAFMDGLKGLGLSPELVAEVIVARNPSGSTGLSVATDQGHALTARAFIVSLKGLGLSPQQIADLARRSDTEGVA